MERSWLKPLRFFVLRTQSYPVWGACLRGGYALCLGLFLRMLRLLDKEKLLAAVYLRRGAARSELVPGGSDLDLLVCLRATDSFQENIWVGRFWRNFFRFRALFLPLGEILIVTEDELPFCAAAGHLRWKEAAAGWRQVAGSEDPLARAPAGEIHSADLLAEALKTWQSLLAALLRVAPKQGPDLLVARNLAKYWLDLERYRALGAGKTDWLDLGRAEVLARSSVSPLTPWLGRALVALPAAWSEAFAIACLDHGISVLRSLAAKLPKIEAAWSEGNLPLAADSSREAVSSQMVRELLAERLLLRNPRALSRIFFSADGAEIYLLLAPGAGSAELSRLHSELRSSVQALERFGSVLLLPEEVFASLPGASVLDDPFRFHRWHVEIGRNPSGHPVRLRNVRIDSRTPDAELFRRGLCDLLQTFRIPPPSDSYWRLNLLESILRLSADPSGKAADFSGAWDAYAGQFPARARQLQAIMTEKGTGRESWGYLYPWLRMELKSLSDRYGGAERELRP